MSRDAVGEVACRSARRGIETELDGAGKRTRNHAIFETPRRIGRVILNVQFFDAEHFAQIVRAHEGRKSGFQVDARRAFDGQQILVAPNVIRPVFDRFARQRLRNHVVIVFDFERAETKLANVFGREFVARIALAALETFEARRSSTRCVSNGVCVSVCRCAVFGVSVRCWNGIVEQFLDGGG